MPEPTTPDEFDPIFRQGVVVVGGHAVNLWGSYYATRGDAALKLFAPRQSDVVAEFGQRPAERGGQDGMDGGFHKR